MERKLREKLPDGKFPEVHPKHRNIMKGVRSKKNKTTEIRFRAALVRAGISGWKLNYRGIKGCPDIFFYKENIAVFLDGCFWHGCEICGHIPKKNSDFWLTKITRNKERDVMNSIFLENLGITVLRFWEHEINKTLHSCIEKTLVTIRVKSIKPSKE